MPRSPLPVTTPIRLTKSDIESAVTPNAFRLANALAADGSVLKAASSPDGRTIRGSVQGSAKRPYSQSITVFPTKAGGSEIAGECSCPVSYNCKHVAAVLLTVLQSNESGRDAPGHRDDRDDMGGRRPPPPKLVSLPQALPVQSAVAGWLAALETARNHGTEDFGPDLKQRLIYVMTLKRPFAQPDLLPRIQVEPTVVTLRPDGSFMDRTSPANLRPHANNLARYVRPSDREILPRLGQSADGLAGGGKIPLQGLAGGEILRRALATGRLRLERVDGPVLREGEPVAATPGWSLLDDGKQVPTLQSDVGGLEIARLAPPIALDRIAATLHPVHVAGVDNGLLLETFLDAPPIGKAEVGPVSAAFAITLPASGLRGPAETPPPQLVDERPVMKLTIQPAELKRRNAYGYWDEAKAETETVGVARLSFLYGPIEIPHSDRRRRPGYTSDGGLYEVRRRTGEERKAIDRLVELGFRTLQGNWSMPWLAATDDDLVLPDRNRWFEVLRAGVPALRAEGWVVEVAPDFPIELVAFTGRIEASLREGSDIDWFELSLGTDVDGVRVDLTPLLAALITGENPPILSDNAGFLPLRLDGRRVMPVPVALIRPILEGLHGLFDNGDADGTGALRVGRFDAAALAAIEESSAPGLVWRGGEALRSLGVRLRQFGRVPELAVPPGLAASLRPYQRRGVDWLQFLAGGGFGGVLADDMGLGKTLQTLAHLLHEKAAGRLDHPALVICPTSLVGNWLREAARFAPTLRVMALHGADRAKDFEAIAAHDVVVTTYPLVSRDHEQLERRRWSVIALDEAQTVKNPLAATTKLILALKARQKLALTGTPLENHLGELWSLFNMVAPGFLGETRRFARTYRTPIEKKGDGARLAMLTQRIKPFLLRRTKAEVAADLPPKTEMVESVSFEPPQRALYESVRLAMHERVREAIAAKGLKRSSIVILDALLKLRQICCDPRLVKPASSLSTRARSAKLVRLMDMVPQLVDEGRRILLFSQFTSMLALIEQDLKAAAVPYVLLTGDTRDRATPVDRFQKGDVPLFLISLKAGGSGLNLTAADTVIHYDPWWNPAAEAQATDRAHRIGQTRAVFVHKLIAEGSVEEKIEGLKARKAKLASGILDPDGGRALDLTEDDIASLFS